MTRGFITLATGNEKYYKLARNMLLSYRLFCPDPMPFAIMCDRENEYTAMFDQVILLENPSNSYWDKFELLVRAPFDETIFVDSDCLAYADWNVYWDYFADADDFTGCGTNYPPNRKKDFFSLAPWTNSTTWCIGSPTFTADCTSSVGAKPAMPFTGTVNTSASTSTASNGRITAPPTETSRSCA